jgi:hypothetical protein
MLDFDARYRVDGYDGIAFYLTRYHTEYVVHYDGHGDVEEVEAVVNTDLVIAIMVGDDRIHVVNVEDLTVLDDDDYCSQCGQVGCTHDGRLT